MWWRLRFHRHTASFTDHFIILSMKWTLNHLKWPVILTWPVFVSREIAISLHKIGSFMTCTHTVYHARKHTHAHIHTQLIFYCSQYTLVHYMYYVSNAFGFLLFSRIDQYIREDNQQKSNRIESKDFIHSIHIRDTLYCYAIKFNIYTMCTEWMNEWMNRCGYEEIQIEWENGGFCTKR